MRLTELELVRHVDSLSLRQLRAWIRRGWVKPLPRDDGPLFTEIDVARVHLVVHLHHEVRLSNDAIALVLSLADQVYGLRGELRKLAEAIEREPAEVQARIRAAARTLGGE